MLFCKGFEICQKPRDARVLRIMRYTLMSVFFVVLFCTIGGRIIESFAYNSAEYKFLEYVAENCEVDQNKKQIDLPTSPKLKQETVCKVGDYLVVKVSFDKDADILNTPSITICKDCYDRTTMFYYRNLSGKEYAILFILRLLFISYIAAETATAMFLSVPSLLMGIR